MEFILNTIFWTLALYGLFEIIKTIIYITTYTKMQSDGIYIIIRWYIHNNSCQKSRRKNRRIFTFNFI